MHLFIPGSFPVFFPDLHTVIPGMHPGNTGDVLRRRALDINKKIVLKSVQSFLFCIHKNTKTLSSSNTEITE